MNRTGIVFWICMTTAVGVSLLTKPETEERLKGLIWNKESLVLPEGAAGTNAGLAESNVLGGDRQCAADLVVYPVSLTGSAHRRWPWRGRKYMNPKFNSR